MVGEIIEGIDVRGKINQLKIISDIGGRKKYLSIV